MVLLSYLWTWCILIWTISECVLALVTRTPKGGGNVQDRGSQILLWIVIFTSITFCEWAKHGLTWGGFGQSSWVTPVSLFIFLIGFALRAAAILTLGKSFSANVAIRQTQTVKKTGLYRWLKHPSYSGLLLILTAIGLHSRHWLSFAIVLLPTTAALLWRISIEERALTTAFGDEYRTYSRATKRLIPGVY